MEKSFLIFALVATTFIPLAWLSPLTAPFAVQKAHAATFGISLPTNSLGLVGYWTFDGKDMPNGRANDVSGNGNNGSLLNMSTSTAYTSGKIGQALKFDGVDDYIETQNAPALDISGSQQITISAWVKVSNFPTNANQMRCMTMITETGQGSGSVDKGLCINNNNKLVFYSWDGAEERTTGGTTLVADRWYHLVGGYNGSQGVVYVNGVQDGTLTSASTVDYTTPQLVFSFVLSSAADFDEYFSGSLDDVRIYNRALSAQEITQLYNLGAAKLGVSPQLGAQNPLTNGLIGYWTFDGKDMPNGRANDVSGNGNNGSLLNISTSTFYAAGKIGQAARFDDVNDKIVISLSSLPTFTVSLWMYNTGKGVGGYEALINESAGSGLFLKNKTNLDFFFSSTDHLSNTTLTQNKWYHVVFTNNAGSGTFYVNGVSDGTVSSAPSQAFTAIGDDGSTEPFGGILDDVRVYNRVLSPQEITQLYNVGAAKLGVSPTNPQAAINSGLVGYWTFDGKDMPNGRANDVSGNGNNGSLTNIATSTFYTAGKIGQALKFDGVDDYVSIPDASVLENAVMSISVWANFSSLTSRPIAFKRIGATEFGQYSLGLSSDNLLYWLQSSDGATWGTLISSTITSGVWHHIIGTNDGTTARLYIDGIQVGTDSSPVTSLAASTNALNIGFGRVAAADAYFSGNADDVRIYNRALSAAEVQRLYNLGR